MPVKSNQLGPGSLTIGQPASAREWGAQLTKTSLTPNTDYEDDVPVLSGETLPGDATTTWELGGTIQQDYDRESLELWSYDNRHQDLPFVFTPSNATGVSWSGVCTVVPIMIGGDVKKRNTSDFTFRCVGEPTPDAV